MNRIQQLQIVLIDTLESLRALNSVNRTLPQSLRCVMQTSEVRRLWDRDGIIKSLDPWQQSVLHTLPADLRATGLAAAALRWCGEGGALRSGTWMQIELVHFAAGLNDVHIVVPDQVSSEEVHSLMIALQPLLSLAGFELHCSAADHWFLWCEAVLDVQTSSIRTGMTTNNYDVLPTGKDAPQLRRLLTEIQMLLHQHPLNQQRERNGLTALNAAWLSGAGSPVTAPAGTMQRIMSDQPYVQGLCDQLNVSCWPVPRDVIELLKLRESEMVLILNDADVMRLDTQWIKPVLQVLHSGYIQQLSIHLDHMKFALQGGRVQQLRRWLSRGNDSTELLN
jgi:hypothetical protein